MKPQRVLTRFNTELTTKPKLCFSINWFDEKNNLVKETIQHYNDSTPATFTARRDGTYRAEIICDGKNMSNKGPVKMRATEMVTLTFETQPVTVAGDAAAIARFPFSL
jgi:hypothetical protein